MATSKGNRSVIMLGKSLSNQGSHVITIPMVAEDVIAQSVTYALKDNFMLVDLTGSSNPDDLEEHLKSHMSDFVHRDLMRKLLDVHEESAEAVRSLINGGQ